MLMLEEWEKHGPEAVRKMMEPGELHFYNSEHRVTITGDVPITTKTAMHDPSH
jgi:hypothetical protein